MSPYSKKQYLEAIRFRYYASIRKEKSAILKEFCEICSYHPKHAIRLLNKKPSHKSKKPGKKSRYSDKEFLKHLKTLWLATDQLCSKRLKAAIPLWLPFYKKQAQVSIKIESLLLQISPASIDRVLKPIKAKLKGRGLGGTKPGTLLKNQIPIRTHNWDINQPGFLEADTVHHCGNSLLGHYVLSLTMTDINSGWTENQAVWTKLAPGVVTAIQQISSRMPFELKGFDCDNGSEFLNQHLLEYFSSQDSKIAFTRSRPYKKNDNAHVEQKNWTHVREWLGYDRFDKPELVDLINDFYTGPARLFLNYFCPNLKLIEKVRINSKYVKKYDKPKTPYQRLLASNHLSNDEKKKLTKTIDSLNPFQLKKQMESKLKKIFKTKNKHSS